MGNLGSIEKVLFGNKVLCLKRLATLAYGKYGIWGKVGHVGFGAVGHGPEWNIEWLTHPLALTSAFPYS